MRLRRDESTPDRKSIWENVERAASRAEGLSDAAKEEMLRRAFVDKRADFIIITSRREVMQLESAAYGVEQGWIAGTWVEPDEQSSAWVGRLTEEGRSRFGL